jgi:hypothetical protein
MGIFKTDKKTAQTTKATRIEKRDLSEADLDRVAGGGNRYQNAS